jgi:hypothetical protein
MRHLVWKFALALATAAMLLSPAARADIVTSGNFKTGSPTPTLNITSSFTLTVSTTGSASYLDLSQWVTNDGNSTQTSAFPNGQTISYQINGGSAVTASVSILTDDDAAFAAITANDGLLQFSPALAVTAGQTLTFLPASLTFSSGGTNFNQPPADFTGNVFLVSGGAARLSPNVSVPEPASLAVLGIPTALVLLRRQRKQI